MTDRNQVIISGTVVEPLDGSEVLRRAKASDGTPLIEFHLRTITSHVSGGQERPARQYHRVVAWADLVPLVAHIQLGDRVEVHGHMTTRTWKNEHGVRLTKTDVVAHEVINEQP
jgi:single-stranded DNA-binding protein